MTDVAPLPVTVVSGYLGAGKTTLVNHLLRKAEGRRILVLVNDFGDIAIDADLIEARDGETLTLANGCICCSLGGDLYYALADALDRRPRPDHLVIEASGVADPRRIADVARAEPEMRLDCIVALADAETVVDQAADRLIGDSLVRQLCAADLIVLNKLDLADPAQAERAESWLARTAPRARIVRATAGRVDPDLLLGHPLSGAPPALTKPGHDHEALYRRWSFTGGEAFDRASLLAALRPLPEGLLRLKGFVRRADGDGLLVVHGVGPRVTIEALAGGQGETRLVGIGLKDSFDPAALERRIRAAAVSG